MGKMKTEKRTSAHRATADPIGSKLALADEIESLKLAKSKTINQDNLKNSKKRTADDDQVIYNKEKN